MKLRLLFKISLLLIVPLIFNSCAAVSAPVNAVTSVANTTVGAASSVATTGIRTAGAAVGAPFALMQ